MKKNLTKSAGGIVIRKSKNGFSTILLYKNNHWVLPKGRIEKNENEQKAALREIYEETNIPLNKMRVLMKLGKINYIVRQPTDNYSPRPKIVTYFLIQTSYKKIKPLKTEGFQRAAWVDLNRALQKSSFVNNKAVILKTIKYLQRDHSKEIDTAIIAVGGKEQRMKQLLEKNQSKLLIRFNGQPFLKYLIDIVLKLKFKKIYLLASYHDKQIENFIKKFYQKVKKIKLIHGGKKGQKKGTPTVLYKIKNDIKNPFIYIDGNIIFRALLLKNLSTKRSLTNSIIRLAISPNDLAPTHLKVLVKDNKIKKFISKKTKGYFCSMGLMAVDNKIFDLLPNFDKFYDLGLLTDYLFKTNLNTNINFIDFIKYKKEWYCIHTKKDVELLKKKGKKFLSSLKIR